MDKPTVFISYSHKDEIWKDRLRPHLQALELDDRIVVWDDRKIDAGDTWYPEIQDAINRARVAVCLISADFLASKFCVKEEIPAFLKRRETEGVVILPVLVRPCSWKKIEWLNQIQLLPRDGKSVSADFKDDWDTPFTEVTERIFEIIDNPKYQPPAPPAPVWAWPEKLDISRLPVTGSELFGRQVQLELLDEAWDSAAANVISFVAWGGVGKSTLVNKWLERLAKDNYRGAERVYAWSFYSQGTTERATSADLFIHSALEWFGDEDPTAGSPWDKGERLARLICRRRTLLVLDGMEPLQSSNNFERGKIKDPALATLLTELARENPGLCLITTREPISDLDEKFVVPPLGGSFADDESRLKAGLQTRVQQINLELLTPEAGRALLRFGGARGTDEELERAAESFGCHALALNLLAVYLQDIPGHHVSAADQIADLDIPEAEGKHPRRVIAAFESKLVQGPEIEVLRMLGLFDRPADAKSIAELRKPPKIPGLTDTRAKAAWLRAVQRLRKLKLIAKESRHAPEELDAHPLVREHFRQQLQHHHPDAWRAANLRLYDYLCATTKDLPDTVEEMASLYAAVTRGCAAGRHQQALNDVYLRRIRRGKEMFNTKKLGANGDDLAVLASFFESLWQRPVAGLIEDHQAFVLNAAGSALFALGRLQEAVEPMQAALQARTLLKNWKNAATAASNLSGLYLTIGDLPQALKVAQQGVALADRDRNRFQRIVNRTTLADALHQLGQAKEAEAAFRQAEEIQNQQQSEYPFLYSLGGFRYCDLLLGQGKHQEVKERVAWMIEIAKDNDWLLIISLDNLLQGRAWLLQSRQAGAGDDGQAAEFLQQAIDGLRQVGHMDYLPRGLLARAELRRVRGEYERARTDLDEAQRIAERSGMGLHLADCHLERARLCLALGDRDKSREHWETAKEMINEMGYHRRDGEVAELGTQLNSAVPKE